MERFTPLATEPTGWNPSGPYWRTGPPLWYSMVRKTNPPAQHELLRKNPNQLDPTLAKLYSQLSAGLSSRIAKLVNEALPCGIHPDRLVKYAFLCATAEQQVQGNAVSRNHTSRAKHELAGEIHGLRTGYRDLGEAKRRYRIGRR